MSVNKVILLGNLGQDPELKYLPDGKAVCNFTIATSESWTDERQQKHERVEWHRIVIYGKLAEIAQQYTSKGSKVYIEGRLQTRSWDDKAGSKRYTTEIIVKSIQFLSRSADKEIPEGAPAPENHDSQQEYDISTDTNFTRDDIPF